MAGEVLPRRLPHHWGQMDGVDQLGLREVLGDPPEGPHDVGHGLAVVLPPVAGHQDDLFPLVIQGVEQVRAEAIVRADRGFQGVDHRVAGDEEAVPDPLVLQIPPVGPGGTEVELGQAAHHGPVHLLREGGVPVPGPQACLHVAHGDLLVKGRQGAGEGGGGVAVDQDQVGLFLRKDLLQAQQALAGDGVQALAGLHDIQIVVRGDGKEAEDVVQHLPVLGGDAADAAELTPALQLLHQGRHLHRLRAGPEDRHDFQGHGPSPPFLRNGLPRGSWRPCRR